MANVLEAVTQIFKTLVNDQPEPPIHAGEAMDIWKYVTYIEEAIVLEQIGRNTTTDNDLLKLLDEALTICSAQSERLQTAMEGFGILIPPLPSDKPRSEAGAIPPGAKMTDDEIANILAAKLLLVTKECCRSMLEAIRSDLGLMWANMLYEQAKFGADLKVKMRERGWLKSPPTYHPPGVPSQ
jgi:Protein of unknown function (DUF3231).